MVEPLEYGKIYLASVDNDQATDLRGYYLVTVPKPFLDTREVIYLGCSSSKIKSRRHMVVGKEKDGSLITYMFRGFKIENGVLVMKNCVRKFLNSIKYAEREFLEDLVKRKGL